MAEGSSSLDEVRGSGGQEACAGSVVIVTGCPGSGKTTLCRSLAQADLKGVHVVSDTFYEFIDHSKDPTTPESRQQNTVIMHALASSI